MQFETTLHSRPPRVEYKEHGVKGCPVDAYQINEQGIVVHLDDVYIGCGYCT